MTTDALCPPLLLACTLAVLGGCESRTTGNEGNLLFAYAADDAFFDFQKAVAVGASLDLSVADAELGEPVAITEAAFDDPEVLDVTSFADDVLTLEALADGTSLLSVQATTAGGAVVTDSVNLRAATADTLELRHTCHDQQTAYYLTGQRAWVPFELMLGSQPVIGYGYYPVVLSDPSLATIEADTSQVYMPVDLGTVAGDLVLTSELRGEALTMKLVGPEFIDGGIEPVAFAVEDIAVGEVVPHYVRPRVGATPVCQAAVTVDFTSDAPEICDVRERDPFTTAGDSSYEPGWFEIEGKAAGTCLYTVTWPDGDNGNGASQQFSVEILP